MDFFRQSWVLTDKTLKIILTRHMVKTLYSALILPVIASVYLGIGQNFTKPNSEFGIGSLHDIISLGDALSKAGDGRNTVVFINGGHSGGNIDRVIDSLSDIVTGAGKNSTKLDDPGELGYSCRSSIRGTTSCFGAVVFHSSPDEGSGNIWNYTLRADGGLGKDFKVEQDDNDAQIYALPLQRAVDSAIAKIESKNGQSSFPETTQQYPYTALTEAERQDKVRRDYQQSFVNFLSVAFLIALIGVCYHMPGFIATERESGMSQLIDAMMPAKKGWHRQIIRLMSHHNAFTLTYAPGWIVASIICRATIWKSASYGIVIIFFLLSGIAITSMSLLSASFFKKAQLSGTVTAVVWIALGIVAQASKPGAAGVVVLSLLFTPCNFVFFITYIARYEQDGKPTNLLHASSRSPWKVPGILLWVFLIIQIFVYPLVAAYIERTLHGVTTGTGSSHLAGTGDAVRIENMTKIYQPSFLRRLFSFVSPPRPKVVAVNDLTLTTKKGEILALLGANGSGKSTTLDAVAGISNYTSGNISIDTTGGLGIAPQKNVLWDELTVLEHIQIFNKIKSPHKHASSEETAALIDAIGLKAKTKAMSGTLSGGQKRKLQLGMMLTGGSAVCCVDEVSSGIDPLSRRKIWDILLSERGSRTIIMTTHFLDEADLLADNIAILSKGTLRAQGSSVQLKDTYGAGYRVHVLDARHMQHAPDVPGVQRKIESNTIVYVAPSSGLAADVIRALEASNIPYKFSGPTIEDVFLNLAEEVRGGQAALLNEQNPRPSITTEKSASSSVPSANKAANGSLALLSGKQVGMVGQTGVFIRKRFTVFKTNWIPYAAAFIIPIIAAAIVQMLVSGEKASGCKPADLSSQDSLDDFNDFYNKAFLVAGPSSKISSSVGNLFKSILPSNPEAASGNLGDSSIGGVKVQLEDSFSSFQTFIEDNRKNVTPGGLWVGDSSSKPTLAFKADETSLYTAVISQNLLNTILSNTSIATNFLSFDLPLAPNTGKGLQLVVYFALAGSIFPGLFGFYPNAERRMNVRGLQYSSGARTVPVWLAHLTFDGAIVIVSMIVAAIILITTSDIWYNGAYLVPVFMLYGVTSVLLAYFVSLFAASSLGTYAAVAVVQGIGFAIYMIAFLFIFTYSSAASTDKNILIGHWVISIFFPTGSLIRALFVGLNAFGATCSGDELESYPGAITAYGGPILYLCVQSLILFGLIVWFEGGAGRYATESATKSAEVDDEEIAEELVRVGESDDERGGLRVMHLTKAFGKTTAVDNVTFGVDHGEVFALLGPNGAGKSTTISLIRGDIAPSRNGGDVFIENISISKRRAAARANLGVCPQFDAIDSMTVVEHLQHYARLRGISEVHTQVRAVVEAVGLEAYTNVMAHTLSGGNKRKLSLGIALTGNPSVILLDEPSPGLDAAAKRIMWRTLEAIVPGRSILLTTHSMEEADALASRAGILARRMLALGDTTALRSRFGDSLHVHMVSETAPHSSPEEMERVRGWVQETFPGARVEQDTYHGQMRFSVPASAVLEKTEGQDGAAGRGGATSESAIGRLLIILEESRLALGIANYSVSPTTLNEVFLNIVGRHDVQEEGETEAKSGGPKWRKYLFGF